MDFTTIILLGIGLSMDAFAVSISSGTNMVKVRLKWVLIISLAFGGFQALMPALGYGFTGVLAKYITEYGHFVALIILSILGVKMMVEALKHKSETEEEKNIELSILSVVILAIATSIDAFAAGVSLRALNISIILPVVTIGLITFVFSYIGVYIGKKVGEIIKHRVEFAGGLILVLIGLKIFLSSMNLK